MTRVFREAASPEYPAYEWDVIRVGARPKIRFTDSSGQQRLSSDIVDEHGLTLQDDGAMADVGDGTHIHVLSGKTYVLTGPRSPFKYHPQSSLVREPEPETPRRSWIVRLLRRNPQ